MPEYNVVIKVIAEKDYTEREIHAASMGEAMKIARKRHMNQSTLPKDAFVVYALGCEEAHPDKYFVGIVEYTIGEMEHRSFNYIVAKSMKEAEEEHSEFCRTFYGDPDEGEDDNGWYFNGGEIFVQEGNITEVSKDTYYAISRL